LVPSAAARRWAGRRTIGLWPGRTITEEATVIRAHASDTEPAADWALPDDEVGTPVVVIPLDDAIIDPDDARRPHCPVCGDDEPMQFTVTPHGRRYDRCTGCGLLWHVDRESGAVVGARQVLPHDTTTRP
jgi:hypothetical protein